MPNPIPTAQHSLLGIDFPEWLPVFDCRWPDEDLPKDPSGHVTMWSSERAEYALGLRSYEKGIYDASCPVSIQSYVDSRNERWKEDAKRWLRDLIARAKELREKHESIGQDWQSKNNGHGGSVCDLPLAIALSNFGASLIADRKQSRTEYFQD